MSESEFDQVLSILSNRLNRAAISVMTDAEQDIFTYKDLSEKIVSKELDGKYSQRDLRTQLNHSVVPRLEEFGIVNGFNSEELVYLGDNKVEEVYEVVNNFSDDQGQKKY